MVPRVVTRDGDDARAELPSGDQREIADSRYQLLRVLGRGGMAVVYEALDRARSRRVALKQLRPSPDAAKRERSADLFELEFHTLAHLAHPRVVEVYDFGIDPSGAYYTMELLDGGDLQQLAPLQWQTACALARDVCSALSLLHSRRLVHRDVSPRNVRRTEAGAAKLIDFGAVAAMGSNKLLVGTPPCCAPECVHHQALDGRTDLYALGATLYYVLVGHHAYGAHSFAVLHDAWQNGFPPPSAFNPEVPPQLDALVLELLRLDPDARPASAAEVAQRLAAIDGEAPREELQVARAYLATPPLMGREAELGRASRRLQRVLVGRSRNLVVVEGPAGVGRSRFLDAVALEATLHGIATLRVDAEDARAGAYGVVAALARRLWRVLPELAAEAARPHAAVLGRLLPDLLPQPQPDPQPTAADDPAPRPQLAAAFIAWLQSIAARRPLAIAVDDFHRLDEASAALFALLSNELEGQRLGLFVSAQLDTKTRAAAALQHVLDGATRIPLANLSPVEGERLFRSLVGDLPKLASLAHRAHALAAGNPRDLLRLAQHLIDTRALRYAAGSWSLATDLEQLALPSSMAQALQARVAGLRDSARDLAWSLALCPDQRFSASECAALGDAPAAAALFTDLESLIKAEVVQHTADSILLAHSSWVPILGETLPPDRKAILHRRLAEVFQRREDQFRAGSHWLQAGETARALDELVAYADAAIQRAMREDTMRSSLAAFRTAAPDWFEIYGRAIRACDELGRPARHKFVLLNRKIVLCAIFDIQDREHGAMLLEQLRRDSGLADYAELAGAAPGERLKLALQRAQERYQSTPESARVLDPLSAIRELSRALSSSLSMLTRAMDRDGLRTLPDLAPLAPLSPALHVVVLAAEGVGARLSGRLTQARGSYEQMLALVERPDRAGLDPTVGALTRHAVRNVLGMLEAGRGSARCLAYAESLAKSPTFEVNAVVIHMLHALFQGDPAEADSCKERIERLRIQTGSRQMYEGAHLVWELDAHAMAEDLTRLRHAIEQLVPLARKYPGWVPVLRCAAAELQRICGAGKQALVEIEGALALAKPGEHQIWASAAACELRVLLDLGRSEDALSRAEQHVASAQAMLEEVPPVLQLLHALALANAGRTGAEQDPQALAERVTAGSIAQGISGLHIGYAHELRARIALALGDRAGAQRLLDECRAIYGRHRNPALSAKLQRLRDAARSGQGPAAARSGAAVESISSSTGPSRVVALLEACRDASERARLALALVLRQGGAPAGFLFKLTPDGIECAANIGGVEVSDWLLGRVRDYLASEADSEVTTHTDSDQSASKPDAWVDDAGRVFRPVLLSHHTAASMVITGLAVVAVPAGGKFVYPADVASDISRSLAQAGDSSLLTLVD